MSVTAPVSLTKIKTEFSGPDTFSSYVRGGLYVPDNSANAGISTTVAGLTMSTFLGASDFVPRTNTYTSGSDTITAPVGATKVNIKLWGGGGVGGIGWPGPQAGGGGGSGGYVLKSNLSVTGGITQFTYSVGVGTVFFPYSAGSASTVSGSGGLNLNAGLGSDGVSGLSGGAGGTGGSASGGDTNTPGNAGQAGGSNSGYGGDGGSAPNGGAGGAGGIQDVGDVGFPPGGGGGGGGADEGTGFGGGNGARGEVRFEWS